MRFKRTYVDERHEREEDRRLHERGQELKDLRGMSKSVTFGSRKRAREKGLATSRKTPVTLPKVSILKDDQ